MGILHALGQLIVSGLMILGVISPVPPTVVYTPVSPAQVAHVYPVSEYEHVPYDENPELGSALPKQDALIDTYLASDITRTDTSMTLVSGTSRDGETLSGYYCFTIDINSSSLEYVCGTASSTSVTGLMRGVKASNPTATSSSLTFRHRRLASVQVTDFPFNQLVQRRINGTDSFEDALTFDEINTYSSALSFTPGSNQLISVFASEQYANNVIAGGAPTSTNTVGGKVLLANKAQIASSTDAGVLAPYVLTTKDATTTFNIATTSVVITRADGKISPNAIATSSTDSYSFGGPMMFTASTTFSSTATLACSNASTTACVINGLPYQMSSSRGASSTVLAENGYGHLSFYRPDWALIAATTTTGALASTTITGIPAATDLKIVILVGQVAANSTIHLQFNNDTTASYLWTTLDSAGSSVSGLASQTSVIRLYSPAANAGTTTIQMNISNLSFERKVMGGSSISDAGGNGVTNWGVWANSSAQISSITIGCAPSACSAGTRFRVYGSNQ